MTDDAMVLQIEKVANRLSKRQARRLLREMRTKMKARADARREKSRQRHEYGAAVVAAGLVGWDAAEIVGLLLDGSDRVGHSPTMRLGVRKRGAERLGHNEPIDTSS